jgi:hypothetical protein
LNRRARQATRRHQSRRNRAADFSGEQNQHEEPEEFDLQPAPERLALAALLAFPIASTSTAHAQSASAGARIVTGTKAKPSSPRMGGRFKAVRVRAKSARNIKTRDSGLLEEIIKDMNRTVGPKLPVDVSVSFAELGEANAYYSPRERQIVISYELLDEIIILFIKNADRNDPRVATKVAQQVIDTLSFVFYHEAAHAMIDLCELPITGARKTPPTSSQRSWW